MGLKDILVPGVFLLCIGTVVGLLCLKKKLDKKKETAREVLETEGDSELTESLITLL